MKRPARKAARNPKSLLARKKSRTTLALPRRTIGGRIRSGVHSNMFRAPRRVALPPARIGRRGGWSNALSTIGNEREKKRSGFLSLYTGCRDQLLGLPSWRRLNPAQELWNSSPPKSGY